VDESFPGVKIRPAWIDDYFDRPIEYEELEE
jgi:hypothetical protein